MKIPEVILIEVQHAPGNLSKVLAEVGNAGLIIEGLQAIKKTQNKTTWELTIDIDEDSGEELFNRINQLPISRIVGKSDRVFTKHLGGKIETISRIPIDSLQTLRDVYTPGVARVCLAIQKEPTLVNKYTNISNTVAIVTNGTAILGLGDVGSVAGLPVMEGKAALFHSLVGLSGIPILLESRDPTKIVETITSISGSFGAIQLEDIAAPDCFEIEQSLIQRINKPVLHDDQHGTAVVVLAALLNATRRERKELSCCTVGQIGLGAAGFGISRLLIKYGVGKMLGADLNEGALARLEKLGGVRATLSELMSEADIVVATTGVKGLIRPEFVRKGQIILSLSNPEPEIDPNLALSKGACFAADGGIVNNVLAFPGLFKGALDARATRFTDEMLFAAAKCIFDCTEEDALFPNPLDRTIHKRVAEAVEKAAYGV